ARRPPPRPARHHWCGRARTTPIRSRTWFRACATDLLLIALARIRSVAKMCVLPHLPRYHSVSMLARPCIRALSGALLLAVVVPFESRSSATIDRLSELVAADMERVNTTILSRTGSQVAMIPEVANHLISSGGKRLRPILTLAMARLDGY